MLKMELLCVTLVESGIKNTKSGVDIVGQFQRKTSRPTPIVQHVEPFSGYPLHEEHDITGFTEMKLLSYVVH
ncbi:hypothetical protein ScPMuIL_002048 [Solemya velum]